MKKKVIKVIIAITAIFLIVYLSMLINTNNVMREVRSAFLLETELSETAGRAIHRYNRNRSSTRDDVADTDLTLVRLFTIHNFRTGYIYVYYDHRAYNGEGRVIAGSQHVFSKWEIERINGEWEIVRIFEHP